MVPWPQVSNLTLLVAADDGLKRVGQVSMGLDAIELTSLDQRGDDSPVLGTDIVTGEERDLSVQGNRANGSLHGVAVHLDPSVGEEQTKAFPEPGDVTVDLEDSCLLYTSDAADE